jgi:hypothetical protein
LSIIRVLRHLAFLALSWVAQLQTVRADIETRYIDDQFGDSVTGALPVYLPVDQWLYGPTCSACYLEKYASFDTGAVCAEAMILPQRYIHRHLLHPSERRSEHSDDRRVQFHLDQHSRTQQRDGVAHAAPFVNQSVPASTKALAAFRRTIFAQGGTTANNAMPSAHAWATAGDVSPPNVHAHQIAMLSTITEGGSHGALGGFELRIPSHELARLRAESSNVQSLQAEIARLRAGIAHDDSEPPPAY